MAIIETRFFEENLNYEEKGKITTRKVVFCFKHERINNTDSVFAMGFSIKNPIDKDNSELQIKIAENRAVKALAYNGINFTDSESLFMKKSVFRSNSGLNKRSEKRFEIFVNSKLSFYKNNFINFSKRSDY